MYGGDVKRPQYIEFYRHKPVAEESDFYQLISMMFGIASFIFKVINMLKYSIGEMGNLVEFDFLFIFVCKFKVHKRTEKFIHELQV